MGKKIEKNNLNTIFLYRLSETPMMLARNIPIKSKEDVIKIVRNYMTRRIEEYFYPYFTNLINL